MAISTEEVKHVAELARLELAEAEVSKFQQELSSILDYITQLQEVDTESVPPTFQTTGLKDVLREDVVDEGRELPPEEVLANAPDAQDSHIKVKPVF